MAVAYVDTSCVLAIALGETSGAAMARRLHRFEELLSSNLLDAEARSAFHREKVTFDPELLGAISWVLPDVPLSEEMERVLAAGYVRGAELWHLACALYLVESPDEMTFLTLDDRQKSVAKTLGFAV